MTMQIQGVDIETVMLLIASFTAGLALGAGYFIALWKTVSRLAHTTRPGRLVLISFVTRLAVLLAGLYFVMGGQWARLAAAMLGFVLMRMILTHYLGPKKTMQKVH